jgi:carboxyl-terminal processing protease
VKYEGKQFIITATREGFGAESCGLKQGMRITHFNGEVIDSAVKYFLPKSVSVHDARMYEYAANMLLAGRHDTKRSITAVWNGAAHIYHPDSLAIPGYAKIIESRVLPSNIGYIKINNSLGDGSLIKAFDEAVDNLWNTKGLIIDLRETPSGGNSIVARAMMSRFIEKELPYQKHILPSEEKQYGIKRSWIELVSPRGRTYKKPLDILVNRWTGSMGEGIAIGFDGMKRALIVGDKMAGLLGANYSFTLPETGIGFSIPGEKLFHVNGMRRENFVPGFLVSGNESYLDVAVRLLRKKMPALPK